MTTEDQAIEIALTLLVNIENPSGVQVRDAVTKAIELVDMNLLTGTIYSEVMERLHAGEQEAR